MKNFKAFLFLAMAAVILSAAVLARPAFAGGEDAEVSGLWLAIPDFPDDAEVTEFIDGGDEVTYTRALDGGVFVLGIHRSPASDETTPEKIKEMIESNVEDNGGGDKDDIDFDNDAEEFAAMLSYPCLTAQYEIGEDEDAKKVANVCVFTDEYIFIVQMMVAADSFGDYTDRLQEWFKGIQLIDGSESGDAPDAEVEGLWLEMPAFPKNAESEIDIGDDGGATYIRQIDGGGLRLVIARIANANGTVTPERVGKFVSGFAGVEEDDVKVSVPAIDEDQKGVIVPADEHPSAAAEYTTEEDEEEFRNADMFFFPEGEKHFFMVHLTAGEESEEKYKEAMPRWFKSLRFVER